MMKAMSEADTIAAALSLPRGVRADLALRLVESLDDPPAQTLSQDEWNAAALAEAQRRWRQIEDGEVKTIPAAEVIAEVRERLRRGR